MVWAPVYCRRFIGRERELDALGERFRAAAQGHGALMLLSGEAGVGKSRLMAEFVARLRVGDERAASADCFEYAQVPLGPVQALLARFGHDSMPPASSRLDLFETLVTTLRQVSAAAPTALVVEDLHWADSATLAFLQYLARAIGELRLLLTCTYRSDEIALRPALQAATARLERLPVVWRVGLGPLTGGEIDELIDRALRELHWSLPVDLRRRIRTLAEGNPLFAEELMKSALDRAATGAEQLPLSITHAVNERLQRFRSHERALFDCAAVIGHDFDAYVLSHIAGKPIEQVASALQRAIEQQLIVQTSLEGSTFAFRHALIRQAIYDRVPPLTRRALHLRIASTLEELPEPERPVPALAYHYSQTGERDKIAYYNERAGDLAVLLYADAGAAEFYAKATQAHARGGVALAVLELKLAEAAHNAGLFAEAQNAYERAELIFVQEQMHEPAVLACMGRSRLLLHAGDAPAARALLHRALGLLEERGKTPLRFACCVHLAFDALWSGAPESALQWLARAEDCEGPWSDVDRLRLHEFRGSAHALVGKHHDAVSEFLQALEIADRTNDAHDRVRCLVNCAIDLCDLGDSARGEELFERAMAIVDRTRLDDHFFAMAPLWYARICNRLGQLDRAAALLERVTPLAPDDPPLRLLVAGLSIWLGLQLEDSRLLDRWGRREVLDEALQGPYRTIDVLAIPFSELLLDRGEHDEARALLHRLGEAWSHEADRREDEWLLVQLALHGNDPDVAVAQAIAQHLARRRPERVEAQAHHALVEACAALRSHDREGAAQCAERAAASFEQLGWPYRRARALEIAGHKAQAMEIYRRIGDSRDARRLEAALCPSNRRGCPKTTLTAREREIAHLVGEGKSNREIAQRLVIGERTVESHVASILRKLDASTRLEIAVRQHTMGSR